MHSSFLKKDYLIKIIIPVFLMFIFISCTGDKSENENENHSKTGSAVFKLKWSTNNDSQYKKEKKHLSRDISSIPIDCNSIGIDEILCKVKNSSGDLITQKSFTCADHNGVIGGLPLNTDLKLIIDGKDSNGAIKYQGLKSGIFLNSTVLVDLGIVEMSPYSQSNTPPEVEINTPANLDEFSSSQQISFNGTGTDAEDGNLSGTYLVWTSNINGSLGSGNSISANLSVGRHIISLKAIDSQGSISSASITITITSTSSSKPIPDTGQTKCYNSSGAEITCPQPNNSFYGQDASYLINNPSFAKLSSSGAILSNSSPDWAMVKDNITGLTWEIKTVDGSIHDKTRKYSFDSAQSQFINGLNNINFGGYSNWRLPTIHELLTIADYGQMEPAINSDYFKNIEPDAYISSDLIRVDTKEFVFFLDIFDGHVDLAPKSDTFLVIGVR